MISMDSINIFKGVVTLMSMLSFLLFLNSRFFAWMDAVDNGKISEKNRESNLFFLLWAFFLVKSH